MKSVSISKIYVKNFRNLETQVLSIDKNICCFYGDNAQGKTNFLEAIYYLLHKKSFRKKVTFSQLLNIDATRPAFNLSMEFLSPITGRLQYSIEENNNELLESKFGKKHFYSIFVQPTSSPLFFQQRQLRVEWIDEMIMQKDFLYKKNFTRFNKILRAKNKLLQVKNRKVAIEEYNSLNNLMAENILYIKNKRFEFIEVIKNYFHTIHQEIFFEELIKITKLKYESDFLHNNTVQEIQQKLHQILEKEISKGISLIGIHRDNLRIEINGLDACEHASMGQQKVSYFSLQFAALKAFECMNGKRRETIVLIDDISSELDSRRWKTLIKYLITNLTQVFITTANDGFIQTLNEFEKVMVYQVKSGKALNFYSGESNEFRQ